MSDGLVTIIGLVHQDFYGASRLSRFLDEKKPDIIALEMSHKRSGTFNDPGVLYKENVFPLFEKFIYDVEEIYRINPPDLEALATILEIRPSTKDFAIMDAWLTLSNIVGGFEFYLAKEYVVSNPGVSLHYIDLPEEDIAEVIDSKKRFDEKLSQTISLQDIKKEIEHAKKGARDYLEHKMELIEKLYDESFNRSLFEINRQKIDDFDEKYVQTVYDPQRDAYMAEQIRKLYADNPEKKIVGIVGMGHYVFMKDMLSDLKPDFKRLADIEIK